MYYERKYVDANLFVRATNGMTMPVDDSLQIVTPMASMTTVIPLMITFLVRAKRASALEIQKCATEFKPAWIGPTNGWKTVHTPVSCVVAFLQIHVF